MLASFSFPSSSFGVLLNANAGRVTPRLARRVGGLVGQEHVFLTESAEHAQQAVRTCLEREYDTIFAGGGDGTIVGLINLLDGLREQVRRLPSLGVLRLGTGNALAHWMGSCGALEDLRRYQAGDIHRTQPVTMVEAERTLFPFASLGHDAAILNDYNRLLRGARGKWHEPLCKGLLGYLLAGFGRTLPRYLWRENPEVRVINLGSPTRKVDLQGQPLGDVVAEGQELYRGPMSLIGAATTPYYGYGMRFFPLANRHPGRFHLRIVDMSALQTGLNFTRVWDGQLQHPAFHDFLADSVRVQFAEAIPYQLGGEARGFRNELSFGLRPRAVELVGRA